MVKTENIYIDIFLTWKPRSVLDAAAQPHQNFDGYFHPVVEEDVPAFVFATNKRCFKANEGRNIPFDHPRSTPGTAWDTHWAVWTAPLIFRGVLR